jgi:hypothetical protein
LEYELFHRSQALGAPIVGSFHERDAAMENLYWSVVEFVTSLSATAFAPAEGLALVPVQVSTSAMDPAALNQLRTHTAGLAEVAHLDW